MRKTCFYALIALLASGAIGRAEEGLVAHWPLSVDGRDASGNGLNAKTHHVDFSATGPSGKGATAASFDGRSSWLEVPPDPRLRVGTGDFSLSGWVYTSDNLDDAPGDIVSQYDHRTRRGFHLAIKSNSGVTFSQANTRQLQFGIDQNRAEKQWTDRGRPGNSLLAFALCVHEGQLFAGTCEPGRGEAGHVYRYLGDDQWSDCGSPDRSNAVTSLVAYQGKLYAGTGKYRLAGSALRESENVTLGGRIFRYEGASRWTDCGSLPKAEAVGGLVVFAGNLYASSLYRPAGFFRYQGDKTWRDCGVPPRPKDQPGNTTHMRVEAMGVYNGSLYATSYDGGRVFRFDGERWFDEGQLGKNTQTYAFAVYGGRLYVGAWPSGRVYRLEKSQQWTDVGRLGDELEVMGMLAHNGRLVAGTLPLAEVYQYEGLSSWKKLTQLDHTPEVRYRRAWTMAEYDGQLFCSTLPSGKIYSWRAGRVAMTNRQLKSGWRHVAAVRSRASLRVFVDGELAGEDSGFAATDYDLTNEQPLRIGTGPNSFLRGRLSDLRLYRRPLSSAEIRKLAKR